MRRCLAPKGVVEGRVDFHREERRYVSDLGWGLQLLVGGDECVQHRCKILFLVEEYGSGITRIWKTGAVFTRIYSVNTIQVYLQQPTTKSVGHHTQRT